MESALVSKNLNLAFMVSFRVSCFGWCCFGFGLHVGREVGGRGCLGNVQIPMVIEIRALEAHAPECRQSVTPVTHCGFAVSELLVADCQKGCRNERRSEQRQACSEFVPVSGSLVVRAHADGCDGVVDWTACVPKRLAIEAVATTRSGCSTANATSSKSFPAFSRAAWD